MAAKYNQIPGMTISNDWWKWGEEGKRKSLTNYPAFHAHLQKLWNKPFDDLLHAPAQPQIVQNAERANFVQRLFAEKLPDVSISTEPATRLKRSTGKSYHDLLKAIFNLPINLPEAVVFPKNHDEVLRVLQLATLNNILVLPFGGGSNVVGAFNIAQDAKALIVFDMSKMKSLLSLDAKNHVATFECGIMGPDLEKQLNAKGFTLGHFPQSFEFSSLGGWIATRSAGQESSHYGRIEDMVISLKVAAPAGTLTTSGYEGDAEGINIKSLFFGSEGLFGIITEAKVRIHPLPENKKWVIGVFPAFENGLDTLRELVQMDIFPSVVRFSDEYESFFLSMLSHQEPSVLSNIKAYISKQVLKWKNIEQPNLMILRMDGKEEEALAKKHIANKIAEKNGGFLIGDSIGIKWETSRFGLPYLRDDLMERGIFVDTMETVLPWDKLADFKKYLRVQLQGCTGFGGDKGILLAHVSHVYTSGASIYFTVITAQDRNKPVEQWKTIKSMVTDKIVEAGGAVSHHHSVGRDHKAWYLAKTDALTKRLLLNIKKTLDPGHIMNPGDLFDE
jgi:alkyldihydroxyacetonephosphate synthase